MLIDDCASQLHYEAISGIELFNKGEFFEAHEALENAWRAEPGPIREMYQGILQVAVIYLHIQRNNYEGARKVAARCKPKLARCPNVCRGVNIANLRKDLENVLAAINLLGPSNLAAFDQRLFKPIHYERHP